jgi:hypothetical protein
MAGRMPPALYAYDADIGRLAVTTPAYNTAIVAVNQRAFPYGGIELARLFDGRQDVAGGIGGVAPASFGVWIRDIRGRRLLASQTGRPAMEPGRSPLRLVGRRRPRGAFTQLHAIGEAAGAGFRVLTRHRFTPEVIDERWSITGSGGRRATVDVLFPSTGPGAHVVAVLRDGGRRVVDGRLIPLALVDRFEIQSLWAAYTVTPLSRPAGATAHALRPAPQSSAPDPGPTLAIQLARGAVVRRTGFAARIRVR